MRHRKRVELLYEEYEAVKLVDYNDMYFDEAAGYMEVSKATFARIYSLARQKIATALVENRELACVKGHSKMDSDWYRCQNCNSAFNLKIKSEAAFKCPVCKSEFVLPLKLKNN